MKNKFSQTLNTTIYSLKTMFLMDKKYLALLFSSVLIATITPFISMNLLRTVINMVVELGQIKQATLTAIILLTALAVLQSINVFVMWYRSNHYIDFSHKFDIIAARKTLDMKYENAKDPEISLLRRRAARGCSAVPRVGEGITEFLANLFKLLGSSAIITFFNPWLLLFVLGFSLFTYLISARLQEKYYENEKKADKHQRKVYYFIETMLNYVSGKEIRVFSAFNIFKNKYQQEEQAIYKIQTDTQKQVLSSRSLTVLISSIQLLILYLFISKYYFAGNALIGDVILYVNLALVFSQAFSGLFYSLISIRVEGERLRDFQNYLELDEGDKELEVNSVPLTNLNIEFEQVWFKYAGADDYALKDISLKIKENEKIAIAGENGSGKTTLIKLLMRLYTPTKGRILINDQDYLSYDRKEYYNLFSTVFQDFNLLALTIRENLHFAETPVDQHKINQALERLDLLDKIMALPDGLDTYLTQEFSPDGTNLSGGERQKLAIVRADYKNAPILILDEPTSAIDPIAEKKLYDNLYHLMGDKTMLMISHRLKSTQICDQIYFMKNGQIVEVGSHEDLLELGGRYYTMYQLQADWYQDDQKMDA